MSRLRHGHKAVHDIPEELRGVRCATAMDFESLCCCPMRCDCGHHSNQPHLSWLADATGQSEKPKCWSCWHQHMAAQVHTNTHTHTNERRTSVALQVSSRLQIPTDKLFRDSAPRLFAPHCEQVFSGQRPTGTSQQNPSCGTWGAASRQDPAKKASSCCRFAGGRHEENRRRNCRCIRMHSAGAAKAKVRSTNVQPRRDKV